MCRSSCDENFTKNISDLIFVFFEKAFFHFEYLSQFSGNEFIGCKDIIKTHIVVDKSRCTRRSLSR